MCIRDSLSRGSESPATMQHSERAINVGGALVPIPGHLATFHSTDAGGLRLSLPFLAEGLRSGQPCFLVAHESVLQRYLDALAQQAGVDLEAAIDGGQFTIIRLQGTAPEAIDRWEQLFASALSTGATVIRLVGEMAAARTMFTSEEEMLRYEEMFDLMFRRYPGVYLCQYDVRAFGGSSLLRALKSHPDLYGLRLGTFLN